MDVTRDEVGAMRYGSRSAKRSAVRRFLVMGLLVCTSASVAAEGIEDVSQAVPDYGLAVRRAPHEPPIEAQLSETNWNLSCNLAPSVAVTVNGVRNKGITHWLVNGRNEFIVERKERDLCGRRPWRLMASLYVTSYRSTADGDTQVQAQKLTEAFVPAASRAISFAVELSGMPEWSWQRAERWDHDRGEIVAALNDMRDALLDGDSETWRGFEDAWVLDDGLIMRAPNDQGAASFRDFVGDDLMRELDDAYRRKLDHQRKGAVAIPSNLSFEALLDDRVVLVRDAEEKSPLRYRSGAEMFSGGMLLSKIDGRWQILGQSLYE